MATANTRTSGKARVRFPDPPERTPADMTSIKAIHMNGNSHALMVHFADRARHHSRRRALHQPNPHPGYDQRRLPRPAHFLRRRPQWPIISAPLTDEKTKTLKHLIWHLRNAAAHGRFTYTGDTDSRMMAEVVIRVEDKRPRSKIFNWRCEIRADDLYRFCIRFTTYLKDSIG